jgi:hypothetical protein
MCRSGAQPSTNAVVSESYAGPVKPLTCSARSSGGMFDSAPKLTAKGLLGGVLTFMLTSSSRMCHTRCPT